MECNSKSKVDQSVLNAFGEIKLDINIMLDNMDCLWLLINNINWYIRENWVLLFLLCSGSVKFYKELFRSKYINFAFKYQNGFIIWKENTEKFNLLYLPFFTEQVAHVSTLHCLNVFLEEYMYIQEFSLINLSLHTFFLYLILVIF